VSDAPAARPDGPSGEAKHRAAIRAWCLYDVANSAFATTVTVAVLPEYFSSQAQQVMPAHLATVWWGYASAVMLLVAALLGPVIGALADLLGARKPLLGACVALGAAMTALLGASAAWSWFALLAIFSVAFLAFAAGTVLYDSMLPTVARPDELHRVSARGFAWGYFGGGMLLALNLTWILFPRTFGLPDSSAAVRLSFVSVGVWWAAFSIPLLRRVPDARARTTTPIARLPGEVGRSLLETMRHIRRHPDLLKFLIAFWLYSDGVGTVIKMASVYAAEVGIGRTHLIGALLMVQLIAAPASLAFGRLAGRVGPQAAVIVGLMGYVGITVLGYFLSTAWHFWVLGGLVALVQGGVQAISRSMFASLIPVERRSEMFGFYSVSEKLAGVAGPLLFALATHLGGAGRLGVLTLLPFFLGGAWLLSRVRLGRAAQARVKS
jgi:UMF1 family MFS transporter